MEHVDVHPEVQLRERLPRKRRVRHVHERTGLVDAALQRVLALAQARLPNAGGVGPLVVVRQDGELLGADHVAQHLAAIRDVHRIDLLVGQIHRRAHGLAGERLHALQRPLHFLGHVGAGSGRGLLVDRRAGKAAVAGRAVEVTRGVDEVEHRANRLRAVADLIGRQVQVDAAVAVSLPLGTRGPHRARLLDELRVETGDLAGPLRGAIGHRLGEVAPHRARDVLRAVGQRHLVLAFQIEVDAGLLQLPVGDRRQIAFLRGARVDHFHLVAGGGHVVAALPLGGIGIPVHQAALTVVGLLVPGHELVGAAALYQIHLLQKARLQLRADKILQGRNLNRRGEIEVAAARGLHVLHHEQGRIGPALHELPVDEVLLNENVLPGQRQRAVGARLQVQPVVGLLARAGQARVDADVRLGGAHAVHQVAAAVVVVRVLRRGAPLHVHARPVAQRHPRGAVDRADPAHEATRALADLGRHMGVGSVEQPLVERVGAVNPLAGRAAHVEDGLTAVLVHDLLELRADGLHGLVPGDALPARLLALGVGALHGMVDAVGVVGRLKRRLRLAAAVARRLERRLVALHLDGAPVLHRDPHAALHLAAAAAARAHALDLAAAAGRLGVLGECGARHRASDDRRGSRGRGQLGEGTAAQVELTHLSSFFSHPFGRPGRVAHVDIVAKSGPRRIICLP